MNASFDRKFILESFRIMLVFFRVESFRLLMPAVAGLQLPVTGKTMTYALAEIELSWPSFQLIQLGSREFPITQSGYGPIL